MTLLIGILMNWTQNLTTFISKLFFVWSLLWFFFLTTCLIFILLLSIFSPQSSYLSFPFCVLCILCFPVFFYGQSSKSSANTVSCRFFLSFDSFSSAFSQFICHCNRYLTLLVWHPWCFSLLCSFAANHYSPIYSDYWSPCLTLSNSSP